MGASRAVNEKIGGIDAAANDIFGELKTEEFYVADKRETKAQSAMAILQDMLNPLGVIVERVLTKDYRFNPEYQKAIEAKIKMGRAANRIAPKKQVAIEAAM